MKQRARSRSIVAAIIASVAALLALRSASSQAAEAPCTDPAICPADAYLHLRERARTETDATAKETLEAQMRAIEPRIGFVAVHAECDRVEEQVSVAVDGKVVPSGGAIPVAPGVHTLLFRCVKSKTEATKQLQISAREKVELTIPVDAWEKPKPPQTAQPPAGCGCSVVGARSNTSAAADRSLE